MRTTLSIDDDVLTIAHSLAREKGISTGAAISDLARAGIRPSRPIVEPGRIPAFVVSQNARTFTDADVRRIEDETP